MAEVKQDPAVEQAAAREKLEQYWLGKCRYFAEQDGDRIPLPDTMYTEWFTPDGVEREVCIGLDEKNEPIWMPKPDGPPPSNSFDPNTANKSQHDLNPAAHQPTFDYIPPTYNSDTQSGGPSNFDGNAGGDDNPRNPLLEGETPDQYKEVLEEYKAKLDALEAEVKKLKVKPEAKGVEALKKKLNGKPE